MTSPERALSWEYRQHARCGVFLLVAGIVLFSAAYAFGVSFTREPETLILYVMGWSLPLAVIPVRLAEHHWLLPISTQRLASVLLFHVLIAVTCLFLAVVLPFNWFTGDSLMVVQPLGLLLGLAAIATAFHAMLGTDDSEFPVAVMIACPLLVVVSGWLNPSFLLWQSPVLIQWSVLLTLPLFGWLLLVWVIGRHRRGKRSLAEIFDAINQSSARMRWQYSFPSRSAADAVCALDWSRARDASVVIGALLAIVSAGIAMFSEPGLFGLVLYVIPFLGLTGFFSGMEFLAQEVRLQGEFRWTLPVASNTLASGMMRTVMRIFSTVTLPSLLAFIGLVMWLHQTGQLANYVSAEMFPWMGSFLGTIVVGVLVGLLGLACCWWLTIAALRHSLIGSDLTRMRVLIYFALVIGMIGVQSLLTPSMKGFAWQILQAGMGVMLMSRTLEVLRYPEEFITPPERSRLLTLWAALFAMAIIVLIELNHATMGSGLLVLGLTSRVIKSFVDLRWAVYARRHLG